MIGCCTLAQLVGGLRILNGIYTRPRANLAIGSVFILADTIIGKQQANLEGEVFVLKV